MTRIAPSSTPADGLRAPEPDLYPAFLRLLDRPVLLVGGGPVALQKARALVSAGARVRAVSLDWVPEFEEIERTAGLVRITRAFRTRDVDGVFLVVAATDDPAVQQRIFEAAEARRVFCNVVDVPDLCSFQVPASLRRGSLTVSVSTAGKSPSFAVALRDRLARLLPDALAPALALMSDARALVRARHPDDAEARKQALSALLTPGAVDHLVVGDLPAFEAHWSSWKAGLPA